MFFHPLVGLLAILYFGVGVPVASLAGAGHLTSPSARTVRWLLYFAALTSSLVPLFLLQFPFRFELSLVAIAYLARDDARGAESLYLSYAGHGRAAAWEERWRALSDRLAAKVPAEPIPPGESGGVSE